MKSTPSIQSYISFRAIAVSLSLGLCAALSFVQMPSAMAQGISGAPAHPPLNGGGFGKLLPGANDAARWTLFTKYAPALIGKTKAQVESLFGKGEGENSSNESVYQIVKLHHPKLPAEASTVTLSVIYTNGKVNAYRVEQVR